MVKEWFIKIDGKEQGPLSIRDLKRHPDVTPDTLCRHTTWNEWRFLREIPELKEVFEEPKSPQAAEEDAESGAVTANGLGELVLDAERGNFPFFIWLLIALLVLLYTWYRLNYF